ncbi:homing endonuclease associated repeat-containing protein [Salinigranum halophilum]|uniref:homing endonuclease associated repeat-containing protein n=1 Tax=Salinigranum halophilum TaxID=2565931 RepID=UPI0010A78C53|nr:hypothetical protein [Salinigranum halophilum]
MTKPYKDPEVLERLYWDEGMTLEELGEKFAVHHTTVQQSMKRLGVPRDQSRRPYQISEEDILDDINGAWDQLGRRPTAREYDRLGRYSDGTAKRRFGRWNLALEAAEELR